MKMKKGGIEVITATAKITGKTPEGFQVVSGEQTYVGKKLVIATGSSVLLPPIPGVQENLGSFLLLFQTQEWQWLLAVSSLGAVSLPVVPLIVPGYPQAVS